MIKEFKQGQVIFNEGDVGTEAYLIKSGTAGVWRKRAGEKVHLAMKCEGDVIGEMSLLDDSECSASVTADTDLHVEVITRDDMQAMLEAAPDVLSKIVYQLMESLRTADDLVSMYSSQLEDKDN